MAISARRIVLNVSTAVKQRRGTPRWPRAEIAISPKRIDVSTTMLNQWKCPSIDFNKLNRHLSTNTATNDHDCSGEIEFTDVADLLSTDFLIRNDGQKVPVSSLKGKLVGLYLCGKRTSPSRMHEIKKVYEKAKSRGYDFEIVQIFYDSHTKQLGSNPILEKFRGDSLWLSLPSVDPCFTKIQRIFHSQAKADHDKSWRGDALFLIHPPQAQAEGEILIDPSGAEILDKWGIKGYPFTRPSLYKAEYEVQRKEITLQLLFPKGERTLLRPRPGGNGFDVVDALSQLSGKRVLALFAKHSFREYGGNFVSVLKSEYRAQQEDNVAEESKFEVVYVSTESSGVSTFDFFTKDMPWLVQPFPVYGYRYPLCKVFKQGKPLQALEGAVAVAFNEHGELIAKEDRLDEMKEGDNLQFPFIDRDLEERIGMEVEAMCNSRARCMYLSDSD